MALQEILQALEARTQEVCASIQQEAEEKAKAPMDRAIEQAGKIRQDLLQQSKARALNARIKSLSDARRKCRKNTTLALAAMINKIIAEAAHQLCGARDDPTYPLFLKKLIADAMESIAGGIHLLIDERDADLIDEITTNEERRILTCPEIDTAGGIIATSEDGRILIRNTMETRLKEVERKHYSDLAFVIAPQLVPEESAKP